MGIHLKIFSKLKLHCVVECTSQIKTNHLNVSSELYCSSLARLTNVDGNGRQTLDYMYERHSA